MKANDPQTRQFLVFLVRGYSEPNGGREWTHMADGVKQYPTQANVQPMQMQLLCQHIEISSQ